MLDLEDTIVALATGAAPAGVAILRLSGGRALEFARRLARLPDPMPPRCALLRRLRHPETGLELDEALVLYFRGPASLTGEDVVELHGHGGVRQVESLLAAAQAAGARAAEPGEFSRRAVLNGRLSLERAEALGDLVLAETEAGLRVARAQLFGALGGRVSAIAADALALRAEVEAALDFPDEAGAGPAGLGERSLSLAARCEALLGTHAFGLALSEGVRVVLAGAPNAGKSSLFNALLGESRALVDPDPGTTRDVVEARRELGGVACTLVDTAGLRDEPGRVEGLGIERARAEIARGGVCLWVVDRTRPLPPPEGLSDRWILVANKWDLPAGGTVSDEALPVSARTGQGIAGLVEALGRRVKGEVGPAGDEPVVTRRRHARLLEEAALAFRGAAAAGLPLELSACELTEGAGALDRILGRGIDDALLDEVFRNFCIGK